MKGILLGVLSVGLAFASPTLTKEQQLQLVNNSLELKNLQLQYAILQEQIRQIQTNFTVKNQEFEQLKKNIIDAAPDKTKKWRLTEVNGVWKLEEEKPVTGAKEDAAQKK